MQMFFVLFSFFLVFVSFFLLSASCVVSLVCFAIFACWNNGEKKYSLKENYSNNTVQTAQDSSEAI